MALLMANATRTGSVNRMFSGVTSVAGGHRKQNIGVPHTHLNFAAGEHSVSGVTSRASVPDGAQHPVAFKFARKTGNIASRNEARITVSANGAAALGRNIGGIAALVIAASGTGGLISSATGTASVTLSAAGGIYATRAAAGTASVAVSADGVLTAIGSLAGTAGLLVTGSQVAYAVGWVEGSTANVDALTPQSIAAAVIAATIEGSVSLADVQRILLAQAAGDATGLETAPAFKSRDGSKTRLAGTIAAGARTITTFDPS